MEIAAESAPHRRTVHLLKNLAEGMYTRRSKFTQFEPRVSLADTQKDEYLLLRFLKTEIKLTRKIWFSVPESIFGSTHTCALGPQQTQA